MEFSPTYLKHCHRKRISEIDPKILPELRTSELFRLFVEATMFARLIVFTKHPTPEQLKDREAAYEFTDLVGKEIDNRLDDGRIVNEP